MKGGTISPIFEMPQDRFASARASRLMELHRAGRLTNDEYEQAIEKHRATEVRHRRRRYRND